MLTNKDLSKYNERIKRLFNISYYLLIDDFAISEYPEEVMKILESVALYANGASVPSGT